MNALNELVLGAVAKLADYLVQKKADRLILAILAGLVLVLFSISAQADFKIGAILASDHLSSDFVCQGEDRKYNETHNGLYVGYKGFFIGRYENSVSGCEGRKYSNLAGYERDFYKWQGVSFSYAVGAADGYLENESTGEYRAFASLNARYSVFKVWYGVNVLAGGLEYRF